MVRTVILQIVMTLVVILILMSGGYGQCWPCDWGLYLYGGQSEEDDVLEVVVWTIIQDAFPIEEEGADSLRFEAGLRWPEAGNDANYFRMCINNFWEDDFEWINDYTIQFAFWDPVNCTYLPEGVHTWVQFCLWLDYGNELAIRNITWYKDGQEGERMVPDHAWRVDAPIALEKAPPKYPHRFTIINDDSLLSMEMGDFRFAWSVEQVELDTSGFPLPPDTILPSVTLLPNDSMTIDLLTEIDGVPTPLYGGHIYGEYKIASTGIQGDTAVFIFDHMIPEPRGFPSMTEWGLLALILLLGTCGVYAVYRRCRARVEALRL
jgi:hypothetical protein